MTLQRVDKLKNKVDKLSTSHIFRYLSTLLRLCMRTIIKNVNQQLSQKTSLCPGKDKVTLTRSLPCKKICMEICMSFLIPYQ